jgi:hypothetical protein
MPHSLVPYAMQSLCFQIPAIAEEHGVTIVVSPLLGKPLPSLPGLARVARSRDITD